MGIMGVKEEITLEENRSSTLIEAYRSLGKSGKVVVWIFIVLVMILIIANLGRPDQGSKIKDLKAENKDLHSQVEDLQSQKQNLQEKVADLEAENADLKAQVEDLKAANNAPAAASSSHNKEEKP